MRIAKLPFVLIDWEGFASGAACFCNGKTIVFGLVGGYFGVEIAKWALEIRIRIGDSFTVPVAIGRWPVSRPAATTALQTSLSGPRPNGPTA